MPAVVGVAVHEHTRQVLAAAAAAVEVAACWNTQPFGVVAAAAAAVG
jgi:hypothetical protein